MVDGALVGTFADTVGEDDNVVAVSKAHWPESALAKLRNIIRSSGCRFTADDIRAAMAEFGRSESSTRHKLNRLRAEICTFNDRGRWVLPPQ